MRMRIEINISFLKKFKRESYDDFKNLFVKYMRKKLKLEVKVLFY